MLDFGLNLRKPARPTFLLIGAHSDDIEIGCGGTVMQLLRWYPQARFHWVVMSAHGDRATEARRGSRSLLRRAEDVDMHVREFRNAYFPSEWAQIKEYLEELKGKICPDAVFCHLRDDLHQDHRVIGELAWNTFRDHVIFEYEVPKYEGAFACPTFYVPLSRNTVERKIKLLLDTFETQRARQWFTDATFRGLMRLRGIECNAASGYAEAFIVRKAVLGSSGRR